MFHKAISIFLAIAIATFSTYAIADSHDDDRIKQLALDAILENPEIIAQAITLLRAQDEQRKLESMKSTLELYREELDNDPNAPVLGNPNGTIVVVEFFDYNCPYCKRVAPDVLKLITGDSDIKLVYREWPVLGDNSVFAARAALAAREQGKYEEMHWALMNLRQANQETVLTAATELGLDLQKLQQDMNSEAVSQHISLSMQLANAIGFSGTPSFVIGNQIAPGAIPLSEMQNMVALERKESNKTDQ
ncbi:DsbA family protein [Maritalea porphyrae]|uniref:DsbA family protein n=1 Tax=Maritalea porphyrae TaxID=880732 RepID=UPI0022AEDE51|nr:DsbA family protein [Maritalea porphyrae]MCZ4273355.1 DsbA family protein [Maritalea porphyrae]